MPNLERLGVKGLSDEQTLMVTCEAILAATSQGKDVAIKQEFDRNRYVRLKVENKSKNDKDIKTLKLNIKHESERTIFDGVTGFVYKNLKDHRAYKLD